MPYPIERKLVVAISSSAVFDMRDADKVFQTEGEEAYRQFQRKHRNEPFAKGVAFPFIRRLLHLNTVFEKEEPVEVVVLSRNDPDSGRRFFESCKHYELNITRGALDARMPAGLVLPTKASDDAVTDELRIAFDFDGVLAGDEAEQIYQEQGLKRFHHAEQSRAHQALAPGPLHRLARQLSYWQKVEAKKKQVDPTFKPLLRIAVITARNAPAHSRCVTTLEEWGLTATETFFMGGINKARVLRVFKPHLFLDDQLAHLEDIADEIPCVHIPFGKVNVRTL